MSPDASQLAERLARQIHASGPISVAEYMRLSNLEYYAKGTAFGVEGDFITAPEVSQMFGELIGLWLTDQWMRMNRPDNCHYVELGPGRGVLAADALRCMARFEFEPRITFVENSEALQEVQTAHVQSAQIIVDIDELPDDGPLLIVANEFFDALPVQQIVATHSGWRERVVATGKAGQFMAMPGTAPMDNLVPSDFRNAPPSSIYETSPDTGTVMYEIAGRLARQGGAMLVVDYGYLLPGLGSTLQAVKNHQQVDPFENPGECDLTAHVNFLEIANLARMRELRVSGPVEQGAWLKELGIEARASQLAVASPERADEIMEARDRLVNADQMGSLFKVLAVSSTDWPTPEGFVSLRPEL
ncbi:class I SAM-dependent methyltransferase [Sphingorhabdus sp.]|uniref:class I SAM-dependent methyltransferase n=1 Tax=Sphingorhabdus sp. TaxID=1902408 RepID=UPI003BAF6923